MIDGAFFLAAAGLIGFAWVVVADFRSRAITHSAAMKSGAIASTASTPASTPADSVSSGSTGNPPTSRFMVKKKDTGEVFPVLAVYREGARNLFLINYISGDQTFNWIPEDEVSIVKAY